MSFLLDEFDDLGFTLIADCSEGIDALNHGVLGVWVLAHEGGGIDVDDHVVVFLCGLVDNLQLGNQSLTKGPASWTMHTKHELIIVWSSIVLDLDGNVQLEVGHAVNSANWHQDIFDNRRSSSREVSQHGSRLVRPVGVVSQLKLDEHSFTWAAGYFFLRLLDNFASVHLVAATEATTAALPWTSPLLLRTTPLPFVAGCALGLLSFAEVLGHLSKLWTILFTDLLTDFIPVLFVHPFLHLLAKLLHVLTELFRIVSTAAWTETAASRTEWTAKWWMMRWVRMTGAMMSTMASMMVRMVMTVEWWMMRRTVRMTTTGGKTSEEVFEESLRITDIDVSLGISH